jgi:ABC-type transport system involved in multi-copper enzyme maturation permease subunit
LEVSGIPEGVRPYPRWTGRIRAPTAMTVLAGEIERSRRSAWITLTVGLGLALGIASTIEIYQFRRDGAPEPTLDVYLAMLEQLRWIALGIAAAAGIPALLEDHRKGALELYFARPLSRFQYASGKAGAVLALTLATVLLPCLLFYAVSMATYDEQPAGWHRWQALGMLYMTGWAVLASGIALALSALLRSARQATLLFLGALVGLEIVATRLLGDLTENHELAILSPMTAYRAMQPWFFDVSQTEGFPALWGAGLAAVLLVAAWAVYAWRLPSPRRAGP